MKVASRIEVRIARWCVCVLAWSVWLLLAHGAFYASPCSRIWTLAMEGMPATVLCRRAVEDVLMYSPFVVAACITMSIWSRVGSIRQQRLQCSILRQAATMIVGVGVYVLADRAYGYVNKSTASTWHVMIEGRIDRYLVYVSVRQQWPSTLEDVIRTAFVRTSGSVVPFMCCISAMAAVRSTRIVHTRADNECEACGYCLSGVELKECPECGIVRCTDRAGQEL